MVASKSSRSDACGYCGAHPIPARAKWCGKKCRQTAWRCRRLAVAEDLGDTPKRIAYADPPYPGTSSKYYGREPDYAGEVDHAKLVSLLQGYDGWALSTSARSLRDVLSLCPPDARVAAWVKSNGPHPRTRGPHNLWEPVIYVPVRLRRPGKCDWVRLKPARGGGNLPGRKPIGFCMWLFELLGASLVDELDDLYPGSGVVRRCWGQYVDGGAARQVSPRTSETSPGAAGDASRPGVNDDRRQSA